MAAWLRGEMLPAIVAAPIPAGITLAQAVDRYLAVKARKRSLHTDRSLSEHLKAALGGHTPLADITANVISAYKARRLGTRSGRGAALLTPAAVNRPLQLLRHLLRLAHEEWEVLDKVPRIRLEREPQGRIRWLEPDEEAPLLAACRTSRNKQLAAMVTVAMETGLRRGELLGLTWDRVDMSRGVIRFEMTKSGRRREVPMRRVVYNVLAALPTPHESRVWAKGSMRTAFENAVAEAGINDFHFHDLRHHFASWYVMRGGALPALQQILGHATLAMTMRYSHLSPKHLREEITKTERQGLEINAPSTHEAVESSECLVSPDAPVAQLDRASDF